MNKEEQQAFDKCMKQIKRLLIEEKQCKQKLERIQKDKMNCINVLLEGRIDNGKTYDIIIEKLERDKISFDREISEVIDYVEYDSIAKLQYDRAKAKRDYCMDLIEFCKDVRNNL